MDDLDDLIEHVEGFLEEMDPNELEGDIDDFLENLENFEEDDEMDIPLSDIELLPLASKLSVDELNKLHQQWRWGPAGEPAPDHPLINYNDLNLLPQQQLEQRNCKICRKGRGICYSPGEPGHLQFVRIGGKKSKTLRKKK